jgi:hypothetical protein
MRQRKLMVLAKTSETWRAGTRKQQVAKRGPSESRLFAIPTKLMVSALISTFLLAGGAVLAQQQEGGQERTPIQAQEQEPIYGSQLMTPGERAELQERMRSAATQEEREQIRREHHERMRQRAAERGVTLPEEPPARPGGTMRRDGLGTGGGMGPGEGMRPGGGMGTGRGTMGPGGGGMGSGGGRGR